MHESKGKHIGKAPSLHLFHTAVTQCMGVFLKHTIGVPTKNPRTNKLDSSMLKSKNQVTLFVNYSYNSFYDFRPSENKIRQTEGYVPKYGFLILYGGYI